MGNKVAIEKNISPKHAKIIEDEYGELMKLPAKDLKEIASRHGIKPTGRKSNIAKQIMGQSYQKAVKVEKVFVRQPVTLTKDQAKGFAKEEKTTAKEYEALGIPKIGKQEESHGKFFAKHAK